MEKDNCDRDHT